MNRTHVTAAVLAASVIFAPATASAGVISAGAISRSTAYVPTAANPSCVGAGTASGPWMELCGYMRGGRTGTLVLAGRVHGKASGAYDARVLDHGRQVTRVTGALPPSASFRELGTVPGFTYSGHQGDQSLCLRFAGDSECGDF